MNDAIRAVLEELNGAHKVEPHLSEEPADYIRLIYSHAFRLSPLDDLQPAKTPHEALREAGTCVMKMEDKGLAKLGVRPDDPADLFRTAGRVFQSAQVAKEDLIGRTVVVLHDDEPHYRGATNFILGLSPPRGSLPRI